MRKWRILLVMLVLWGLVLAAPTVQAGGTIDLDSAIRSLGPIIVVNALVTALVNVLLMRGCSP